LVIGHCIVEPGKSSGLVFVIAGNAMGVMAGFTTACALSTLVIV